MTEQVFYKVTNRNENHNGFQYKDGLNILDKEFDNIQENICSPNGLYFTTFDNIYRFIDYGVHIREVYVPVEAQYVVDIHGCKYRSDMIVLGKKYEIRDIETIKYFNLDKHPLIITNWAAENGELEVLTWLKNNNCLYYSSRAVDYAAGNGHIKVLDFFKELDFELLYTENAIDFASSNNHMCVLKWFCDNKYHLKYTVWGMWSAKQNKNTEIMNWFESKDRGKNILSEMYK